MLLAFLVGYRNGVLLLRHLRELGLQAVFQDFDLVAQRKNLLVFHLHGHLQLDHVALSLVPLTFDVVNDLILGQPDLLLEGLDFLFEQLTLFSDYICILMSFEKVFLHLDKLL